MTSPGPGTFLPRSVPLALWWGHLAGRAGTPGDDLARCLVDVQADDEPHEVRLDPSPDPLAPAPPEEPGFPTTLAEIVSAWAPGIRAVVAAFPASGDVAGVPSAASGPAVEAHECVLVECAEGSWALVPEVTRFGSRLEPGHLVTWSVRPVPVWRTGLLATTGDLRQSERELRRALIGATEALTELDVAAWSRTANEVLSGLTSWRPVADAVPEGLDPQRERVLSEAARLRYIVETASGDDGGAVNVWQADQRGAALRHIDTSARRAMSAATFYEAPAGQPPARTVS